MVLRVLARKVDGEYQIYQSILETGRISHLFGYALFTVP